MAVGMAAVMGTTLEHNLASAMTERVLEDVGIQMPTQMEVPASRSPSPNTSVDSAFAAADQALKNIEDFQEMMNMDAGAFSEDDCSSEDNYSDGSFS